VVQVNQLWFIYNYIGGLMKTKTYELTKDEVFALKEACTEHYHQTKNYLPISPAAKRMYSALKSLKEQFTDDYRLWKE